MAHFSKKMLITTLALSLSCLNIEVLAQFAKSPVSVKTTGHEAHVNAENRAPIPTVPADAWYQWLKPGKSYTLQCELKESILINTLHHSHSLDLQWHKRHYVLHYVPTESGAQRYEHTQSGLVFIQLAEKVMLMNAKEGRRLANECVM